MESIINSADPKLFNEDLAPVSDKNWGVYNFFALWMSDIHSIGGYVTAGSLFSLGLYSWQVLIVLLAGIMIIYWCTNLISKPSQVAGVSVPVVCRSVFGVYGAFLPALIRGIISTTWYGIQTFLASVSLNVALLKLFPNLAPYAQMDHSFLGLPFLGWFSFLILWVLQAMLFYRGIDAIRRFIDFCGPAIYVVMIILCGFLIYKAGWGAINLNIGNVTVHGWSSIPVMLGGIMLIVSYFSAPILNFGDFSRLSKSDKIIKKGNLLGLPLNFLVFSILVVVTTSLTLPLYGKLITDPVETVSRLNNTTAILLGSLTFVTATLGINIVANFISPAFDFSNLNPKRISWKMGGTIVAIGSLLMTPWNLYNNPAVLQNTIELLSSFIGPIFGLIIVDYYLVKKQKINVPDLYSSNPAGTYWYSKGHNLKAISCAILGAIFAVLVIIIGNPYGQYSWLVGVVVSGLSYYLVNHSNSN